MGEDCWSRGRDVSELLGVLRRSVSHGWLLLEVMTPDSPWQHTAAIGIYTHCLESLREGDWMIGWLEGIRGASPGGTLMRPIDSA